jgi:hypothetical protein
LAPGSLLIPSLFCRKTLGIETGATVRIFLAPRYSALDGKRLGLSEQYLKFFTLDRFTTTRTYSYSLNIHSKYHSLPTF